MGVRLMKFLDRYLSPLVESSRARDVEERWFVNSMFLTFLSQFKHMEGVFHSNVVIFEKCPKFSTSLSILPKYNTNQSWS